MPLYMLVRVRSRGTKKNETYGRRFIKIGIGAH